MEKIHWSPWLAGVLLALTVGIVPSPGSADPGDGLSAGDLVLHPRLTLRTTYDQNVFRLSSDERDPIDSPLVGVRPGFRIITEDATTADFTFDGSVEWEEYLSDEGRVDEQSGVNANGSVGLTLNPNGGASFTISDQLDFTNEPPPGPGGGTYNRLVNRAGASVGIHPGDRILQFDFGYELGTYRYFTDALRDLDKDSHNFHFDLTWQFLQKTAIVARGTGSLIRYRDSTREDAETRVRLRNVDSTPVRALAGLSGLLSRRLSARLLVGGGTSLYDTGPTYTGPLGQADLSYQYGTLDLDNKLSLSYKYDFKDSSIGNFYTFHRAGLNWEQNFLKKRFGVTAGFNFTRRDYSSLAAVSDQISEAQTDSLDDNLIQVSAGVNSQIFKWWRASLTYDYSQNISGGGLVIPAADVQQLRDFNRHVVTLSTTFEY